MSATQPVPAAQYVRMSTEHQQYSLENQTDAICKYAALHDFEVTQTYSDSAKSGVILRNRPGLQQLLKDVVSTTAAYRAILVYDVMEGDPPLATGSGSSGEPSANACRFAQSRERWFRTLLRISQNRRRHTRSHHGP